MKILEEAMGFGRRYGPTVIAHLLFLLWVGLFVVDRRALPDVWGVWSDFSASIGVILKSVGLSLEHWYVIAALLFLYLTTFEWLREAVVSLPLLRVVYLARYDPDLLARACSLLNQEPDVAKVATALDRQIDRAREQVRQSGQHDPYQWLANRAAILRVYYGAVLLGLFAVLAWLIAGVPRPRSEGRVALTAALLWAIALALRWTLRRLNQRYRNYSGWWALSLIDASDADADWHLRYELERAARRRAAQRFAADRHPAWILERWLRRLPRRLAEPVRLRLCHPRLDVGGDWELVASSRRRFSDEPAPVAAALDARPFASRFGPLLERKGTGLTILVPERSGLALAAEGEGAVYSFARRRHEHLGFGIRLVARPGPDAKFEIGIETSGAPGFLASAGAFPLASLVARQFPDSRLGWGKILYSHGGEDALLAVDLEAGEVGKIPVARRLSLEFGDTYVAGIRTEGGTTARLAFQGLQIERSETVLIAWAFLDAWSPDEEAGLPLPWWRPAAWRSLIV